MEIVSSERRRSLEARESVRDREVHNLQRRIEKLNVALDETEHRLVEVTAIKNIDEGISSVYKEVQGLHSTDKDFSLKQDLMADIFQANLRLQKGAR